MKDDNMHVVIFLTVVGGLLFLIIQYLVKNGLFPPRLEDEPETTWEDR